MGRLASLDRSHVLDWLHHHPEEIHGNPESTVLSAERAVRRQAVLDAWREAKDYVDSRMRDWERGWGFHASDAYVALEVCPLLARALRSHERHVHSGDEEHLIGRELLGVLEPEAREVVGRWAIEVAELEHHRVWEEIVRYTRRRGRELVRAGLMPRDLGWEVTENFEAKAARVAAMLGEEFASRASRASQN